MIETSSERNRERVRAIAARRIAPDFMILSRECDVVIVSPGLDADNFIERVKQALGRTTAERADGGQAFDQIDETTLVRIVPLAGEYSQYTAVFIERVGDRGSTGAAARRYGLTKRETEVLELVVRSCTNAQIAEALCIASVTVGDHLKSMMRKTKCARRSELIARVYNLDHESPHIKLL
jgi:DNA-binding CsgD family transcriptional regulator